MPSVVGVMIVKRLRDVLRGLSVDFIEPTNLFEQLEERVVLDASITPVADQNVDQGSQMTVDVQAADEGHCARSGVYPGGGLGLGLRGGVGRYPDQCRRSNGQF